MKEKSSVSLPSIFFAFLRSDPIVLLDLLDLGRKLWEYWKSGTGIYEVIDLHIALELCDSKGIKAVYRKKQRVRFLQNNIIAYQDQAWGDGDIFAKYHCSPGVPVDRYREGHRHRILISLRETKNKGDVANLMINRTILNGFVQEIEELQTEIDHPTRHITIQLTFPRNCQPNHISLIEQNSGRSTALDSSNLIKLPNGKHQVTWERRNPRRYEAFILRWHW